MCSCMRMEMTDQSALRCLGTKPLGRISPCEQFSRLLTRRSSPRQGLEGADFCEAKRTTMSPQRSPSRGEVTFEPLNDADQPTSPSPSAHVSSAAHREHFDVEESTLRAQFHSGLAKLKARRGSPPSSSDRVSGQHALHHIAAARHGATSLPAQPTMKIHHAADGSLMLTPLKHTPGDGHDASPTPPAVRDEDQHATHVDSCSCPSELGPSKGSWWNHRWC